MQFFVFKSSSFNLAKLIGFKSRLCSDKQVLKHLPVRLATKFPPFLKYFFISFILILIKVISVYLFLDSVSFN